ERRGERIIKRRHGQARKLGEREPANLLAVPAFGFALPGTAGVKQDYMGSARRRRRLGVTCKAQRKQLRELEAHAEFLLDFAQQAVSRRFSGPDLAAGEFPQPAVLAADAPPLEQNPPLWIDQGDRHDENGCRKILQGKLRSKGNLKIFPRKL